MLTITRMQYMLMLDGMHVQVAVKLLRLGEGTSMSMLQGELKVLLHALRHSSHVVRVLGVTVVKDRLAIVMRKYPCSLRELIAETGGLGHAPLCCMAHDTCDFMMLLRSMGMLQPQS